MSTILEYKNVKIVLEEITDEQKAQFKIDKPQIWESLFGTKANLKGIPPVINK